jgi:hypothetical protein
MSLPHLVPHSVLWRHDIHYNDTKHNDIQHNKTVYVALKMTHHNRTVFYAESHLCCVIFD